LLGRPPQSAIENGPDALPDLPSLPVGTTPDQAAAMVTKIADATHRMFEENDLHRMADGIKANVRGQSFIDVEIVMKPPNESVFDAIHEAELRRFRPIMLTIFGGLTPIILETSRQAIQLIPMTISLGFGIVFATSIILVIVPCLYLILEDVLSAANGE